MTGVKTQNLKSEQEKNITINLGYANSGHFTVRKLMNINIVQFKGE